MSSYVHNKAKTEILKGNLPLLSTTIKVLLVTAGYAPDPDHDYVSSASGSEISGTGYVAGFSGGGRQVLANKSVTQQNTEDRGVFLADPNSWSGLNAGTPAWAILYIPNTSDADSMILATIDIPNTATNGSKLDVNWDTLANGGIFFI